MPIPMLGTPAPEFTLPDKDGGEHSLSKERGKWVLLYFYPKDNTPGCTTQACAIRDEYPEFEKLSIRVFGISADSVKSHAKFSEKYHLPFTLLSDEKKVVLNAYGVWQEKTFMGRTYMGIARTSFLVDPKGNIAKIYENVRAGEHVNMVLSDLKNLVKG
jgi:thioredoxin-dependent peroxiredoxin